jgi:hypothetical protein
VRFKVKAGREQQLIDAHNNVALTWPGLRHANMVKTGEHTFCIIAEWDDLEASKGARANMIATLNSFRGTLEELEWASGLPMQSLGRLRRPSDTKAHPQPFEVV